MRLYLKLDLSLKRHLLHGQYASENLRDLKQQVRTTTDMILMIKPFLDFLNTLPGDNESGKQNIPAVFYKFR